MLRIEVQMKRFFAGVILPLLSCVLFPGCSTADDVLQNKIAVALNGDNEVDEQEWTELILFIQDNAAELPDYTTGDTINEAFLREAILNYASSHIRSDQTTVIYTPETNPLDTTIHLNFFIENSGSMDGYVKGFTDFEAALADLIVQVEHAASAHKTSAYFINSTTVPINYLQPAAFFTSLEPGKQPYQTGNKSSSKLNEIIKTVLDSTRTNTLSVLVSDCIYSLAKGANSKSGLDVEKPLIKGIFLMREATFVPSSLVLQMTSEFEGSYYAYDGTVRKTSEQRPYYIWLFAEEKILRAISEQISFYQLKGYQNSYYFKAGEDAAVPEFVVLMETGKTGRFQSLDRSQARSAKSIEVLEFENGELRFSVAANLAKLRLDSTLCCSKSNYLINSGFQLDSICPVNKTSVAPRDMQIATDANASHVFFVSTTEAASAESMELRLNAKLPDWVYSCSVTDDRAPLPLAGKTFGFNYLVEGVFQAYQTMYPKQQQYFYINVPVKK